MTFKKKQETTEVPKEDTQPKTTPISEKKEATLIDVVEQLHYIRAELNILNQLIAYFVRSTVPQVQAKEEVELGLDKVAAIPPVEESSEPVPETKTETTKVQILSDFSVGTTKYVTGDTIEVPSEFAKTIINSGLAKLAE